MKLYHLHHNVKILFISPLEYGHCFGYYYSSPVSCDGKKLLAHRIHFADRDLVLNDEVEVGYFNLESGSWHSIALTRAFNWQQGAMLQWLGPDYNGRVIFNDQKNDHFVSCIVDIDDLSAKTLSHAIYAVHPSGGTALGVSFERHYFTRAYHYEGVCNRSWDVPLHEDDGIYSIDLNNGDSRTIIRTTDIARCYGSVSKDWNQHWLEHLLWNKSGNKFAFLYRFGNNNSFCTRVFTADASGKNLQMLSDLYDYSHMGWRSDTQFAIYAKRATQLGTAYSKMTESKWPFAAQIVACYRKLKPLIPSRYVARSAAECGYALVDEGREGIRLLNTGTLYRDGHPSWTRSGRFMLTDTYADDEGFRHLILYDAEQDQVHTLGRFGSPYNNSGYRCDLHPRFSPDEQLVIIDTAHNGRRQILVLEVDWSKF